MEIRLGDLWAVFKHCWWIMALVAVVVAGGLYIFLNSTHEDEYTATATTYIMNKDEDKTSTSTVSISNALVKDFVAIADFESVLESVIYEQGASMTPAQFRKMIKVSSQDGSRLVEVSVTAKDPQRAYDLSNSLARQMCEKMNQDMLQGQTYASVPQESILPKKPSNPVSLLKILLVALVCAVVVYGIYLVMFLLDDKINTPEDIERYLDLSLLGQIPNKQDAGSRKHKYYAADPADR